MTERTRGNSGEAGPRGPSRTSSHMTMWHVSAHSSRVVMGSQSIQRLRTSMNLGTLSRWCLQISARVLAARSRMPSSWASSSLAISVARMAVHKATLAGTWGWKAAPPWLAHTPTPSNAALRTSNDRVGVKNPPGWQDSRRWLKYTPCKGSKAGPETTFRISTRTPMATSHRSCSEFRLRSFHRSGRQDSRNGRRDSCVWRRVPTQPMTRTIKASSQSFNPSASSSSSASSARRWAFSCMRWLLPSRRDRTCCARLRANSAGSTTSD
mmetsp:Transcript_115868/g.201601  ORF Transcript_115868/g.201601 Transcript_115868/m.201601 type:complete len:267 (-) Transcript_115868:2305-3105(-)